MNQIIYPTKWQLGKPRGSIKEIPTGYQVVLSPPKEKQINKYFIYKDYENSKEKTYQAALEFKQNESDKRGLTRNQIRYLNKNVIEVKLTQDKTMKTNMKFLNEVQKYPINLNSRKTKEEIRYYAVCQDKKKRFPFTDLICDYKIVEFIDGDSLNLIEENLKEFCTEKGLSKK